MELVGTAFSFVTGSVGEGEFTEEGDRAKLAEVMQAIVRRKLLLSLRAGDLPSYRRHLNLQAVHLRGFEVEPLEDILPLTSPSCDAAGVAEVADVAGHFLHQNGFRKVRERDASGWCPMHYAALSGRVQLTEALLRLRADLNGRTSKDEPKLGFGPWMSALDLAVSFTSPTAFMNFLGLPLFSRNPNSLTSFSLCLLEK